MPEKLSAFVEDTPKHRMEDQRQEKINELLTKIEGLLAEGKKKDDPEVVVLSDQLKEWTSSGAKKSAMIERLIGDSLTDEKETVSSGDPKEIFAREPYYDEEDGEYENDEDEIRYNLLELEKRNTAIYDDFMDFHRKNLNNETVDGLRQWFSVYRSGLNEYKADIEDVVVLLPRKRQEYYRKQIMDLESRVNTLLATIEPNNTFYQLRKISQEALQFFMDYKDLHYSCIHEAAGKESQ